MAWNAVSKHMVGIRGVPHTAPPNRRHDAARVCWRETPGPHNLRTCFGPLHMAWDAVSTFWSSSEGHAALPNRRLWHGLLVEQMWRQ